jgi:hypothetical protein
MAHYTQGIQLSPLSQNQTVRPQCTVHSPVRKCLNHSKLMGHLLKAITCSPKVLWAPMILNHLHVTVLKFKQQPLPSSSPFLLLANWQVYVCPLCHSSITMYWWHLSSLSAGNLGVAFPGPHCILEHILWKWLFALHHSFLYLLLTRLWPTICAIKTFSCQQCLFSSLSCPGHLVTA